MKSSVALVFSIVMILFVLTVESRGQTSFPGIYPSPVNIGSAQSLLGAECGDVNNDGHLDVVVIDYATRSLYTLLAYGTTGNFVTPASASSLNGVSFGDFPLLGDFDNDGRLDVVTSSVVTRGQGNGLFQVVNSSASFCTTARVTDVNRDGLADIVGVNYNNATLTADLGLGNSLFNKSSYSLGVGVSYPQDVIVADFNGDQIPDAASANQGSNNVSVLLGTATGSFASAAVFPSGGIGPLRVVAMDYNHDGRMDIIVTHYNNGNKDTNHISLLAGDGTGNFQLPVRLYIKTDGAAAKVADFTLDGLDDLAIKDYYGIVHVLPGQADPASPFGTDQQYSFSPTGSTIPSFSYGTMTLADLNNDRKPDLGFTDGSGNFIAMYNFLNPACLAETPTSLNLSSGTRYDITLSWTDSNSAGGSYEVQLRKRGDAEWTTYSGLTSKQYLFKYRDLVLGADYDTRVRKKCATGFYSAWSGEARFTVPCVAAERYTASAVTETSFTLSWQDFDGAPVSNFLVELQYLNYAGAYSTLSSNYAFNTSSWNNLQSGTEYRVAIRRVCNGTPSSDALYAYVRTLCPTPKNVTVGAITTTSATVSWIYNSNSPDVKIYFHQAGTSGPWTTAYRLSNTAPLSSLSPGTTYEVQLYTNCGPYVPISGAVTTTFTTPTENCSASNLRVTDVTSYDANVSWDGATAGVFRFEYRRSNTSTWTSTTTTQRAASIYVDPNVSYYARVRAECANGTITPWVQISFSTPPEEVCPPRDPYCLNSLSPNPADDQLRLDYFINESFGENGELEYRILDQHGWQKQSGKLAQSISVSDLPRGIYLLQIIGRGKIITRRFTKN